MVKLTEDGDTMDRSQLATRVVTCYLDSLKTSKEHAPKQVARGMEVEKEHEDV